MPQDITVVYNQFTLDSWRGEIQQLSAQIMEHNNKLTSKQQEFSRLQSQLTTMNTRITTLQFELQRLEFDSAEDILNGIYPNPDNDYEGHSHQTRVVQHVFNNFVREAYRTQLNSEFWELVAERSSLITNTMNPLERDISLTREKLSLSQDRNSFLREHIPAAEAFLHQLDENPFGLVSDLSKKLQEAFTHYEDTHLTNLSPEERISVMAVRYGLGGLIAYDNSYNPESVEMKPVHRENYLRLCGFIWDMYSRVSQQHPRSALKPVLASLLGSTHVLHHGDLPEPWQTHYNAQAWFDVCKQVNPEVFVIQVAQLPQIEEQIVQQGLAVLTQSPPQSDSLHRHIAYTAHLIDMEIKMKQQKQEPIDYYFYGRVVRILEEALSKPNDLQTAKRLSDIAEYSSGKASVGKQVLGGFLITLGILLIGASVACFVATLGASTVLSACGMALGLSLLQTAIVLGTGSTLAVSSGIGLTFFAGPNAIKSGQRQGIAQALSEIKDDMEAYGEPPAYSVA